MRRELIRRNVNTNLAVGTQDHSVEPRGGLCGHSVSGAVEPGERYGAVESAGRAGAVCKLDVAIQLSHCAAAAKRLGHELLGLALRGRGDRDDDADAILALAALAFHWCLPRDAERGGMAIDELARHPHLETGHRGDSARVAQSSADDRR